MFGKKTKQSAGDNSQNNYASRDVINIYGADKHEITEDVIKEIRKELPLIKEEAIAASIGQVSEFLDDVIGTLIPGGVEKLKNNLKDPDKLTTIITTLQCIAKKTSKADKNILKKLLIEKINDESEDGEGSLIIDKAIDIATQLSKNQIMFIGFVSLIRYYSCTFNFQNKRIEINHLKHHDITESIDKGGISVLINHKGESIGRDIFNQAYYSFYTKTLEDIFLEKSRASHIRKVDFSYLETIGCIEPTKGNITTLNTMSISEAISKNIGEDIKSDSNKQKFELLYNLVRDFQIAEIDNIACISLTSVGYKISEAFLLPYIENVKVWEQTNSGVPPAFKRNY